MKTCRNNNPFEIRRMSCDDFLSSSSLEKATTNRKVDVNKEKISWLGTHQTDRKIIITLNFTRHPRNSDGTSSPISTKNVPEMFKMFKMFKTNCTLKRCL